MAKIGRRALLKTMAATMIGGSLLSACNERPGVSSGDSNRLNIFSWADYLSPDTIPDFEKRYNVKVVYDTFASNEALLARMQAGSVDYDIIVPSSYAVAKLKKLNLLKEIDSGKIANFANIEDRFTQLSFDPGNKFSVPYTFGTTGIGYNSTACKELGVPEPTDWDAFWDKQFAGRITLLEDARESLGFALKHSGHSYNSVDPTEINQARDILIAQKPLTMCYTSDQVIIYLASGDSRLSLAFSGDAHQARRTNPAVSYIIPNSGASMWVDNMCIPASAPNPDNALKWINYILEPEVSAKISNFTYYPMPNKPAKKFVKAEMLSDNSLYPPEHVLDRCDEIRDIGDAIFLFDRAWTELKCV